MKQLPSVWLATQSADEIIAYLAKSSKEQSSEKIVQGIALHTLDSKRPEGSGTLKKYVLAKCGVAVADHAFSVAVAFRHLNGTGSGHVEEQQFVTIPLTWHLLASAILNAIAKPETGLSDTDRAAVHEEVAKVYRDKPDKGEELLKLIKARYKKTSAETEAEKAEKEKAEKEKAAKAAATVPADPLSDEFIKAIGMAATTCEDAAKLTRAASLLDYIRTNIIAAKLAEMGVTEVPVLGVPVHAEAGWKIAFANVPVEVETPVETAAAA